MIAGHDRHQARDQPAQPRPQPDVDEAFHDDLPGQRAGQGGVLAGAQQRQREQRAAGRRAQERRQQLVGVADVGHRSSTRVSANTAAETIRMAALMNSADISAIDESSVAKRIASALLA